MEHMPMRLSLRTEAGPVIEGPNAAQLTTQLDRLNTTDNRFAVLSRTPQIYVQSYANKDGSFHIELRAGGPEEHYTTDRPLGREEMKTLFLLFDTGPDWRTLADWVPMKLGGG